MMTKLARLPMVAALLIAAGCSGGSYSALDDTDWLDTEHGLELQIGSDGEATLQNQAKEMDRIDLTYGVDPENPTLFLFQAEGDEGKEDVLRAELPGYKPPAEGEEIVKPEKMDELRAAMFGRLVRFVAETPETREEFDKQVTFAREQAKKLSISDAPKDPSSYVDVVEEYGSNWATYYVLAQDGRETSDEEKLGMLSTNWNSTRDSFDREAMKASELEAINSKISAIGQIGYVSLPLGNWQITGPRVRIGDGYDFERKGFPLSGDMCRSSMNFQNENRVSYIVSEEHGADLCFLTLDDQSVAQQVERLRSTSRVESTGIGFYKLGPVDGNTITLLPVGADIAIGDYLGGETVFETMLWGPERTAE